MKKTMSFDGITIEVEKKDLNKDGVTGGIELIKPRIAGETEIMQKGELEGSLNLIDSDIVDPKTRMSELDKKTRLHRIELPAMITWDTLVAMKVLPQTALTLTMKKSRYAISLNGLGREERRDIIIGKREHDRAMMGGFQGAMRNAFGIQAPPPQ